MRKKFVTIVLFMGLTASLMAGCGSSNTSSSESPADTTSSSENTEAVNSQSGENVSGISAAGTGDSAANVTLHVVDINADNDEYNKAIDAFEAAHPGVKVETNHAVNDSQEVISSLIASNDIPDVIAATPEYGDVYKEFLYDWKDDADTLAQFKEGYVDSITEKDGSVLGLPCSCINVGLVYNKDILKEAGYDEIPLTISGFEQMCSDISEKTGVVPFIVPFETNSYFISAQMLDAYIITKDQPGSVCADKFNSGELKVSEASGNFSNFWKMMDIATKYTSGETLLEYDWEYACNLIANGKAAIMTYGDWAYNPITQFNADINLGFSSYPVSENADDSVTPTSVSQIAMLNKNSDNFDVAKELAIFLTTSPESAEYWVKGYGSVPCSKAADDLDSSYFNPLLQQSSKNATEGKCVDRLQNYYPTASGVDFMKDAADAIQGYVIGTYTSDEATEVIDDAWPVSES